MGYGEKESKEKIAMTFMFRHPKYYKELKKIYENEKVICERCKRKVTRRNYERSHGPKCRDY